MRTQMWMVVGLALCGIAFAQEPEPTAAATAPEPESAANAPAASEEQTPAAGEPADSPAPTPATDEPLETIPVRTAGPEVVKVEEDATQLDEVVVTAQKRVQRLVDVPINVSAMDRENIERTRIEQVR